MIRDWTPWSALPGVFEACEPTPAMRCRLLWKIVDKEETWPLKSGRPTVDTSKM